MADMQKSGMLNILKRRCIAQSRAFEAAVLVAILSFMAYSLGVGAASGEMTYVDKELTTTGQLDAYTGILPDYDTYLFNLSTSETISYSVTVLGRGQVQVFLAKGHDSLLLSEYNKQYSTDTPMSSYSNEFSPSSLDDTTKFQIGVVSAAEQEVNYSITLKISKNDPLVPTSVFVCIGVVILVVLVAIILVPLIIIIIYFTRKKKGQSVRQTAQSPRSDPYGQHGQWPPRDPYGQHPQWDQQGPCGQYRQYPPSDAFCQHGQSHQQEQVERNTGPNRFCPECGSRTTSYNGGGEWCDDCGGFV